MNRCWYSGPMEDGNLGVCLLEVDHDGPHVFTPADCVYVSLGPSSPTLVEVKEKPGAGL